MAASAASAPSLAGHAWWLASRAAGLLALGLITIAVAIGLALGGRLARRPGLPRILSAIHEQVAMLAIVAVAVHGLTLLGDPWLDPGIAGISIPFAMSYRPLWTGLGIIGGYVAALLGLSFYARRRIGPRLWRHAHRFTIVAYALAVVHTVGAGTDASTPWLRWWLALSLPAILVLFAMRLLSGLRRSRRPASAPGHRPRPERHRPLPEAVQRAPMPLGEEA